MPAARHIAYDESGHGAMEANVPGINSGGEAMPRMDPDSRQRPSSQQPEARMVTVPAEGFCQVSGERDGMYSRKFVTVYPCSFSCFIPCLHTEDYRKYGAHHPRRFSFGKGFFLYHSEPQTVAGLGTGVGCIGVGGEQ